MGFCDPFAAYNAGSNLEAHLVCGLLIDAGVEAVVVEDVSQVGTWMGGSIAEIHKPQVWIERSDSERAKPVLADYEHQAAVRRAAKRDTQEAGEPILVVCEECGKPSEFPGSQRGSVQSCPHCRAYVDVGDEVGVEGWDAAPEEETAGIKPEVDQPNVLQDSEVASLVAEPNETQAWSKELGKGSIACGVGALISGMLGTQFKNLDQMSYLAAFGTITIILAIAAVVLAIWAFRARRRDQGVSVYYPVAGLLCGTANLFCGSAILVMGSGGLVPTDGTPWTWRSEELGFEVTVPSERWTQKANSNVLAEFTCPQPPISAGVAAALPAGSNTEYETALAYGDKVKRDTPTSNTEELTKPNRHGHPCWVYTGDAKHGDQPYFFGISITRVRDKAVLMMFEGPYRLTSESGHAQEARAFRTQANLFLGSVK